MKNKVKKLFVLLTPLFILSGCGGIERGDCVLIAPNTTNQEAIIKAEYIKFDDGAHWYIVDDEIKSTGEFYINITSCED